MVRFMQKHSNSVLVCTLFKCVLVNLHVHSYTNDCVRVCLFGNSGQTLHFKTFLNCIHANVAFLNALMLIVLTSLEKKRRNILSCYKVSFSNLILNELVSYMYFTLYQFSSNTESAKKACIYSCYQRVAQYFLQYSIVDQSTLGTAYVCIYFSVSIVTIWT